MVRNNCYVVFLRNKNSQLRCKLQFFSFNQMRVYSNYKEIFYYHISNSNKIMVNRFNN